jgi:gamma-glutamyltranspeptidase
VLGLFGELALAAAHLSQRVGGGPALLAAAAEKRRKSPTAATIDSAIVASTPGIVISRRASATRASAASMIRSSWPWKSSWRNSAATAPASSGGSGCSASHARPL